MEVSPEEAAEGCEASHDEHVADGLEMVFGDEDEYEPSEICLDDIEDDDEASDLPASSGLPPPSSQPIFDSQLSDPSDPIEDVVGEYVVGENVVEENVGGGKGEKDDAHRPRPVARPLTRSMTGVNPKSLPYDPNDDEVALFGSDASDGDDVEVVHESVVAVPAGSSSTSSGSGSDRAAKMKAIMDQMKALQERLDSMHLINHRHATFWVTHGYMHIYGCLNIVDICTYKVLLQSGIA